VAAALVTPAGNRGERGRRRRAEEQRHDEPDPGGAHPLGYVFCW
jgi:hypothetical protein